MARPDDLRGYALKRKLGIVPYAYPPRDRMRGVQPPIGRMEAERHQADAARRRGTPPAMRRVTR